MPKDWEGLVKSQGSRGNRRRSKRTMRKLVIRAVPAVAARARVIATTAPGGAPAATTGACKLSGQANVSPGLTTATKAISFGFTGTFSNCQGTGKVKKGTVTASGSGTGSCSGNSTSGTA